MSITTNEGLITKINSLFAKAQSTTHDAEADLFLEKAEELMIKYNIDRVKLIQESRKGRPEIESLRIDDVSAELAKSYGSLAKAVANFFSCEMLFFTQRDKERYSLQVYGERADLEDAEFLYKHLKKQLDTRWKAHKKVEQLSAFMTEWEVVKARRAFNYGFGQAVRSRLMLLKSDVLKTESKSTELAVIDKQKRAKDHINETFESLGKTRSETYNRNHFAYGRQEGEVADLGRKNLS